MKSWGDCRGFECSRDGLKRQLGSVMSCSVPTSLLTMFTMKLTFGAPSGLIQVVAMEATADVDVQLGDLAVSVTDFLVRKHTEQTRAGHSTIRDNRQPKRDSQSTRIHWSGTLRLHTGCCRCPGAYQAMDQRLQAKGASHCQPLEITFVLSSGTSSDGLDIVRHWDVKFHRNESDSVNFNARPRYAKPEAFINWNRIRS